MEYIKLLNSFDQWLESNTLPVQSQLLWYRLAAKANRAGWPEWVQVENRELMAMVKVTREATFIEKVRSPLLENNLIEYKKGKKGYPGRYRFFYIKIGVGKGSAVDKQSNCPTLKQEEKGKTSENVVESVVNSVAESVVNNVVQSVVDSVAIYRPNQTKPDQERARAPSPAPTTKRKRGAYGWVKLTDGEYDRLVSDYGKETADYYIGVVDEKAQLTGNKNKWKDWNLTVRNAVRGKWGGAPPVTLSAEKDYGGDQDFLRE